MLFALKLWQLEARYEMAQRLKTPQKTERLTFGRNHFKETLSKGCEFDWKNKRYDVVKASYSRDSVTVDAVVDKLETGIVHSIHKLVSFHNEDDKEPVEFLALSVLIFVAPLPDSFTFSLPQTIHSNRFFNTVARIRDMYNPVKSPPPRYV